MERYLRFYIKFQGYMIGVFTLVFSVLITMVIFNTNNFTYPLEYYYNYRFMGAVAVLLGVMWFGAGAAFLYGVYRESKQCLLPFALLYLIDLFLIAIRDILMLWHDKRFYSMVFTNLPSAFVTLYITCYLLMTLIALSRLFSTDPKPEPGSNFIRFNNGIQNPITVEEEADELLVE
ncbi:uncharacterized protein LOC131206156 [Anopheles bellator]|uniref:uncharacterized protein LOC131206156 n=1 Tax=Anopheles bellator TaxID=139047 RepID=UPI002647EFEC|nr:uncharacterized protein LOC131206156 [Anopheles bellator]